MPRPHSAAFTAPRAKMTRSSAWCDSTMRSPVPARNTECSPTTEPPRSVAKPIAPPGRTPVWPSRVRTLFSRKIDAASGGRRLAEQQRRAGRRVDLVAVMHLEDLDVEVARVERPRRLFDQDRQQVDAEAHIARLDDRRVARRRGDPGVVVRAAAGRADDMHDARLRGVAGELDGRGRHGEVEHAVGLGEGRQRIVGHGHVDRADAGDLAGILAEMRRAGPLDGAGDAHAFHGVDGADQRLAHAAGGAHDDQAHVAQRLCPLTICACRRGRR